MSIFSKELRTNRISLLLWSLVAGGLMAMCVAMYPAIGDATEDMTDLFANMGNFSAAFGLNMLNIGSFMGFYGVECGTILSLGGAFFAALMGIASLAGEEGGHTAEFLLMHPISRQRVAIEKLLAVEGMIIVMNVLCMALSRAAMAAVGETVDGEMYLRYHGALLCMQMELGAVCFGVSAFLRRGGYGLAMGLAALLYFLNIAINLNDAMSWLSYVTPFYYADAARVLSGETMTGAAVAGGLWTMASITAGIWWYTQKDIAA